MSNSKAQFAESILLTHLGGKHSSESNFTLRQVLALVDIVSDGVVWEYFQAERLGDGFDATPLITVYPSHDGKVDGPKVKYNTKIKKYYIDLPAKPLVLPSGRGVWKLSPLEGQETPFSRSGGHSSLMARSDAGGLEGEVCYDVIGKRVEFERDFPATRYPVGTELYLEMITTGSAIKDGDPLTFPDAIKDAVFERVLAKLNGRQSDDTNDNADKK